MVISKTTQSSQSSLPLTDYNGSGVFKQWYAYGNYIDEVIAKGTAPWPVSAMFYIHDHLYSPAALTNYWGTVLERYEYDAYGNCYVLEPNFAPDSDGESNYGNPYLFTGRRVDILDSGSLKLQYNRNRYYDYYSGRFTTHDPLAVDVASVPGDAPTAVLQQFGILNLYEYALSQPMSTVDSWGLWGTDVHSWDTQKWAVQRGLCFSSHIGCWDAAVDEGLWERPIRNSIFGTILHLLHIRGINVGRLLLNYVAYWHFPGADVGQTVVPGGPLARREIEKGIKSCNLWNFSRGLHQLQDSFSHQSGGRMPPWLGKVAHSRDWHGWYWEKWDDPEANPLVLRPLTIRAIQWICMTNHFWCSREMILKASRKAYTLKRTDADNRVHFVDAYRGTEGATKYQMDTFRTECPCIKEGPFAGECVICQGVPVPKYGDIIGGLPIE